MSKYIWWLAVILICVRIFAFSAQDAQESTDTSLKVTKKIVNVLPSASKMSEEQKEETAKNIDSVTRKMAHFAIYALLGFSAIGALRRTVSQKAFITALLLCVLFAVTDEIHQMFVPGRSCQITDVLTDSFGTLVGMLAYIVMVKILNKLPRKA